MEQILLLINEMAPYLLLGFFIAGLMHAFIPQTLYSRYLARRNFKSVALATLFGILTAATAASRPRTLPASW